MVRGREGTPDNVALPHFTRSPFGVARAIMVRGAVRSRLGTVILLLALAVGGGYIRPRLFWVIASFGWRSR